MYLFHYSASGHNISVGYLTGSKDVNRGSGFGGRQQSQQQLSSCSFMQLIWQRGSSDAFTVTVKGSGGCEKRCTRVGGCLC